MFTDMVGYTALLQADEHVGVGKRDRYWAALDRQHEPFGGAIVQRLGDGSVSRAQQEGIVNVYSEATQGREFLDRAQDALPADQIARATEIGRRLTIKEAVDLARPGHLAAA